jgi:hypothetical protein
MEVEILGPVTSHRVIVSGRQVPFLDAAPANGGKIHLSLDDRYGLDLAVADADRIIEFIADCIAVALGYTCHPRDGMEPLAMHPFRRHVGVDWVRTDGGELPGLLADPGCPHHDLPGRLRYFAAPAVLPGHPLPGPLAA